MDFSTYRQEMNMTIKEISSNIEIILKNFLEEFGMTMIQYRIISSIHEKKKMTIGELSNSVAMDAGNMSSMCKKLEKSGYLTRARNSRDERIVEVSLTDLARNIIVQLNKTLDSNYKTFFEKESSEDLQQILVAFRKVGAYFSSMAMALPDKNHKMEG